jgi:hypothetical protein
MRDSRDGQDCTAHATVLPRVRGKGRAESLIIGRGVWNYGWWRLVDRDTGRDLDLDRDYTSLFGGASW